MLVRCLSQWQLPYIDISVAGSLANVIVNLWVTLGQRHLSVHKVHVHQTIACVPRRVVVLDPSVAVVGISSISTSAGKRSTGVAHCFLKGNGAASSIIRERHLVTFHEFREVKDRLTTSVPGGLTALEALDLVNVHHHIHSSAVSTLAYLVLGHVLVLSVSSVQQIRRRWPGQCC